MLSKQLQLSFIAFFTILFLSNSANGQDVKDQLLEEGFENVSVAEDSGTLRVAYENRTYRFEPRALASVLEIAGPYASENEFQSLSVLVRHQGLPFVTITTPVDSLNDMIIGELDYSSWRSSVSMTLDTTEAAERLSDEEVTNTTWFQPVFPVGLGMRYQLGNYNNPYRFAFDLEPGVRLPLGKGWMLSSTAAIPLYNDFDDQTDIRPIRATLTKQAVLDEGVLAGISGGLFSKNRVGIHGALQAFLYEEVLSLTLEAGYTTFTDLSGEVSRPQIEDQNYAVYTATATYRWKPYDLDLSVQYGQYLYRDNGVTLRADRYFGEVEIGFFLSKTRLGENAGFQFSIPIFPSKYRNSGAVRVRPAERFPVTYRYRGNDYDARIYDTGITFREEVKEVYPSFILKEMQDYFEVAQ